METLFVALRVLLSLGAVLALLWLLQRRFARGGVSAGKARSSAALTVVGRQNVGAKASVVVLEHDGRRFLLGVTEHGVNVLHSNEIAGDAPAERVVPDAAATAEFDHVLHSSSAVSAEANTFARVLAEAGHSESINHEVSGTQAMRAEPSVAPVETPAPAAMRESKLAGSILAPETWKQAAAFVRNGR